MVVKTRSLVPAIVGALLSIAAPASAQPVCRWSQAVAVADPGRTVDSATFEVQSDGCIASRVARGPGQGRLTWSYTSTNQPDHERHCVWDGPGLPECTGRIYIPGTVTVRMEVEGQGQVGAIWVNYI